MRRLKVSILTSKGVPEARILRLLSQKEEGSNSKIYTVSHRLYYQSWIDNP